MLQTLVDDLSEREARMESNNRKLNQKILELESKLEEARGAQNFVAPRVPGSREELELKLAEANKKVKIHKVTQGQVFVRISQLRVNFINKFRHLKHQFSGGLIA